jgi:hypothetical protein
MLLPGTAGLYGGGGGGYGTAVGEAVTMAGGVHGFPAARTSFVGRAGPVREVAVLPERFRPVTGLGGSGTGLTVEGSLSWWRACSRTGCEREGCARARGMPGRPRGAGGLGVPGVTCGGVAA